jgi:hypothetical protein
MPVTAKLSKAFYDRLGEQIVNELVQRYNLVDATYRSGLPCWFRSSGFGSEAESRWGRVAQRPRPKERH